MSENEIKLCEGCNKHLTHPIEKTFCFECLNKTFDFLCGIDSNIEIRITKCKEEENER